MSDTTNPQERPATQAESQANKHVQHLQRVFGRDDVERNASQKHVVDFLQRTEKMVCFMPTRADGKHDPIAAAIREGQRQLAGAILAELDKDPVSKINKPTVTK